MKDNIDLGIHQSFESGDGGGIDAVDIFLSIDYVQILTIFISRVFDKRTARLFIFLLYGGSQLMCN